MEHQRVLLSPQQVEQHRIAFPVPNLVPSLVSGEKGRTTGAADAGYAIRSIKKVVLLGFRTHALGKGRGGVIEDICGAARDLKDRRLRLVPDPGIGRSWRSLGPRRIRHQVTDPLRSSRTQEVRVGQAG